MLKVKILTPQKVVKEEDVDSILVPSSTGQLSILPHHAKLLTTLEEGIVTLKTGKTEEHLAVGGGYLETDGKEARILVSRAYGQQEIDEAQTKRALEQAKKDMAESKDEAQLRQATTLMRRSIVDLKLLKKHRRGRVE